MLFTPNSPKPLYYWKLDEPILAVAFLSSYDMQAHHRANASAIVCITQGKQEIANLMIMEEYNIYDTESSSIDKNSKQYKIRIEDKQNLLDSIYGTNKHSMMQEDLQEVVASNNNASLSASSLALFDAPSHVLPPITILYKSFMERLLISNTTTTTTMESSQEDNKNNHLIHGDTMMMEMEKVEILSSEEDINSESYNTFALFFTNFGKLDEISTSSPIASEHKQTKKNGSLKKSKNKH